MFWVFTQVQQTMTFLPINLGSDKKSLLGTGIFFTIYSHITSILYLSWADTGIIGAPSAIVPRKHKQFLVVLDHNDFFFFHFRYNVS